MCGSTRSPDSSSTPPATPVEEENSSTRQGPSGMSGSTTAPSGAASRPPGSRSDVAPTAATVQLAAAAAGCTAAARGGGGSSDAEVLDGSGGRGGNATRVGAEPGVPGAARAGTGTLNEPRAEDTSSRAGGVALSGVDSEADEDETRRDTPPTDAEAAAGTGASPLAARRTRKWGGLPGPHAAPRSAAAPAPPGAVPVSAAPSVGAVGAAVARRTSSSVTTSVASTPFLRSQPTASPSDAKPRWIAPLYPVTARPAASQSSNTPTTRPTATP